MAGGRDCVGACRVRGKRMDAQSSSPIACRSILTLGGARSGKSHYARKLAEETARERLYLATGWADDEEMSTRIARHQAERGTGWTTLEEPLALCAALEFEARADRIVLVDCLTFWLANAMFAGLDIESEAKQLCQVISSLSGPVIFVSNEVGSGIVPENKLGREFRDRQGKLNQDVARACDCVVLVAAGLPILLKPAPAPKIAAR
jgi:adenosylcobinamide kinase / adenosylcobinamide-phosphate guanylyltransferase